MTIQQLIYAVKVADVKSMNKAAAELFISQPALSSTIRNLEEELHTDLFIRSNRGILITPEGEEFLSYARQMTELEKMIEDRFSENKNVRKKFSVSMQHYSFAVEAFIQLAKEFGMENYEFSVHETKTGEVIENVRNYRSEIGVLYLRAFSAELGTKLLYFVPRDNIVQHAEIHKKTVIEYRPGSAQAQEYRNLAQAVIDNKDFTIPTPMTQERLEEILLEYGMMDNLEIYNI